MFFAKFNEKNILINFITYFNKKIFSLNKKIIKKINIFVVIAIIIVKFK